MAPAAPPKTKPPDQEPDTSQTTALSNPALDNSASIRVSLPADAKLTFDGNPTKLTSNTRHFSTPPLEPGSKYKYVLRAVIVRDGVQRVLTRDVVVRANEETRVSLDFASSNVAVRR